MNQVSINKVDKHLIIKEGTFKEEEVKERKIDKNLKGNRETLSKDSFLNLYKYNLLKLNLNYLLNRTYFLISYTLIINKVSISL